MQSSSLFRRPSKTMMASLGLSGAIIVAWLSPVDINVVYARRAIRALFGVGHVLALLLYARVVNYINGSYTSYTSNNEFGYSNSEKAVFREENWRVLMVLLSRGLVALGLHTQYQELPLLVCSILNYTTLAENALYVKAFWRPGEYKFPKGNIPRSQSGRLL